MQDVIYLDYNATTPCLEEVELVFREHALKNFGNPSSEHFFGKKAKDALEKYRKDVADFLGAEPEEIIFTSGGTESNHLAIYGILWDKLWKNKNIHIVISAFEHPSVLKPIEHIGKKGVSIDFVPVTSDGYVEVDEVKKKIRKNTVFVSIMLANNEIGTIQPVKEIAELCKEKEIIFHTDASQAVGKIPVNVKEINCDLLSFSGHKMYAPKGIGALFVKKGIKLSPIFLGGNQERGLRAGTEPLPLIASLGVACKIIKNDLNEEIERLLYLRNKFIQGLKRIYPEVHIFGIFNKILPNTIAVCFKGIDARKLLKEYVPNICASTGSACHKEGICHSIKMMNISKELAKGFIRFSIGRFTNLFHIEKALEILEEGIRRMKNENRRLYN